MKLEKNGLKNIWSVKVGVHGYLQCAIRPIGYHKFETVWIRKDEPLSLVNVLHKVPRGGVGAAETLKEHI